MSTTETTRPAGHRAAPSPTSLSQDDCPTEVLPIVAPAPAAPVRRSLLRAPAASAPAAPLERSPFAGRRAQAQTEELPAVSSDTGLPTPSRPSRPRPRRERAGRPSSRRRASVARHLRQALTGLLIAVAILTGLQLYAAAGISQARQAALAERDAQASEQSASSHTTTPPAPPAQTEEGAPAHTTTPTGWEVEGTTTAAPSPLDLPRCTTSPDTPLPCLATISPSQTRAVVLEEDASLTALIRR